VSGTVFFDDQSLVHFFVRSKAQQEDSLRPFMFDKIEHDPKVVACAARPGTPQLTLQLVGFKTGMKAVCGEQLQGRLKVLGGLGVFSKDSLGSTQESART
jgi:hypothetical protein